jgi:hypothetical protein
VTLNVYVSSGSRCSPRYGFLAPNTPMSLLPRTESWKFVRSADALDLGLSETDVEQLLRRGCWERNIADGHWIR